MLAEPHNLPIFYANTVHMTMTLFDFTLTLGLQTPPLPDGTRQIHQLAQVVMSPQHMKLVVKTLAARIDQYEQRWGPIPDPKPGDIGTEEWGDTLPAGIAG